ncbi:polymorphic outer membrane protein, partial [Chlamydia psittaci 03DC29]
LPPPEPGPEPEPEVPEGEASSLIRLKDANLGSIPSPVGIMHSKAKSAEVTDNSVFTFEGNSGLTFSGNSSSKNGGAIYAKNLKIVSGGPTLFTDNTAQEAGGAIAIADGGTLSLTAESGDIIFKGNKGKDDAPNAINIGSTAKITDLRASQGSSIIFYDPIT